MNNVFAVKSVNTEYRYFLIILELIILTLSGFISQIIKILFNEIYSI